jgi:hypothetical protein
MTPSAPSRLRAKPARPPLCLKRCTKHILTTPCAEITPLRMRSSTSLSLWQTKGVQRTGKHLEPQSVVCFLH